MTETNLDLIRENMRLGNFSKALDDLITILDRDNFSTLPEILEGILEIQNQGLSLNYKQIEEIKPIIRTFDEISQELALKIVKNNLARRNALLKQDINYLIDNMDRFEVETREEIVQFLIDVFMDLSKTEKIIAKGLLGCLDDDLWSIRKKIIEFLNDKFLERPEFLKEFETDLEILFNETDVDVIKEILDFLLNLFIKTYKVNSLENLIESIPDREWYAQEKILFLLAKLGVRRPELIRPVRMQLILLLDYEDFLVNTTMVQTIEEILKYHPESFDDVFFTCILQDCIDNIEAIENIITESIIDHKFSRFYGLFQKINLKFTPIVEIMNSIIKKLNNNHPKLINSLCSKLTEEIMNNLSEENFEKMKILLESNRSYNIYSACYKVLDIRRLIDNQEERRKKLWVLIREEMPELGFEKLSNWLDIELMKGPVFIKDVCNKFHIDKDQLTQFLKELIKRNMIDIAINDNQIALNDNRVEENEDLFFLKKWRVLHGNTELEYDIELMVRVKNITKKEIGNLNIILNYPKEILTLNKTISSDYKTEEDLAPEQEITLKWIFTKQREKSFNPITSTIDVSLIYEKENNLFSVKKSLDILLV